MGAVKARAIEALTGMGLGAAGIGGVRALTHEPRVPTEWLDDQGQFHSRDLTTQEKKQRQNIILRAALAGAALGAGVSLGAGALRRSNLAASELAELAGIKKERLAGLKNVVREFEVEANKAKIPGTKEMERRKKLLSLAENRLKSENEKIDELLDEAIAARHQSAWGGLKLTGAGKTPVPHETLTHRGQVERRFRDLEAQALKEDPTHPPLQSVTDPDEYGQRFFRTLLKKQASANAMAYELGRMYESVPFLASRGLMRLVAEQSRL